MELWRLKTISIHSSHTGRDPRFLASLSGLSAFQSTLPIREETCLHGEGLFCPSYFNPLFPYGKRPPAGCRLPGDHNFNPLFPYGKRHVVQHHRARLQTFQSTLPIREETDPRRKSAAQQPYFNPLFPYGKRRDYITTQKGRKTFQSTLPIREETFRPNNKDRWVTISIHSSHTGRDAPPLQPTGRSGDFNPLFPYGKRLSMSAMRTVSLVFQSTLPIREETIPPRPEYHLCRFQSTLPIREETLPS